MNEERKCADCEMSVDGDERKGEQPTAMVNEMTEEGKGVAGRWRRMRGIRERKEGQ